MLEDIAKDYAAYFNSDDTSGFQAIQDVVDDMMTRLEELTSVLQMVKMKNGDCSNSVTGDISKYKHEINTLSKKVVLLNEVILKMQDHVDMLEKQLEKAEIDFGVSNDNKLKSLFKPFLKKNMPNNPVIQPFEKINFRSVLDNFEGEND